MQPYLSHFAPVITLLLALLWVQHSHADETLFQEIQTADNAFFEAFNRCDIETMGNMLAEDLEFYHDIAGVSGYDSTMQVTQNNCDRKLGLERTLLSDSIKVYPVKDFGAIQIGEHRFCHEENGKPDCGVFGFTHIWQRTESGWLISRVVSYGH